MFQSKFVQMCHDPVSESQNLTKRLPGSGLEISNYPANTEPIFRTSGTRQILEVFDCGLAKHIGQDVPVSGRSQWCIPVTWFTPYSRQIFVLAPRPGLLWHLTPSFLPEFTITQPDQTQQRGQ